MSTSTLKCGHLHRPLLLLRNPHNSQNNLKKRIDIKVQKPIYVDFGIVFHPERIVESRITIPRSYSAEQRKHKPSIREKWISELVEEKRKQDEEAIKYRPFKANKVPTFYERDKGRKEEVIRGLREERDREERENTKYEFKANPMPWFCSLQLLDRRRQEQQQISEMRKKIRQQWLKMNSKLPPRMQEHIDKMHR